MRIVRTFRRWIFADAVSAVGAAAVLFLSGGGGCFVGGFAVFAGYLQTDFESAGFHGRNLPFSFGAGGMTPVAPRLSRRNASA